MSWHRGLRVARDDGWRGRHVRAISDVAAGELLLSEDCVAAMVYRDANPACCSACLEPLDTKSELKCERCKVERYCSEACRRSGSRAYHSSEGECAAFEAALEAEENERRNAVNTNTNTTTEGGEGRFHFEDLPQRFLLRVLSQAGKWRAPGKPMTGTKVNDILTLEAHVPPQDSPEHAWLSAISRNTLRLMDESVDEGVAFQLAAATAQQPDDVDEGGGGGGGGRGERREVRGKIEGTTICDRFGVPQLTRLMCCVNRNSHTLYAREDRPLEPVGTAVYLQGSAFNHSCRPNAEFYNVGTSLRVRSVQHISSGEEVTVSYVPLTESLAERRRSLSRQYKFTCTCERCQQEEWEEDKDNVNGGASKRIKR